MPGAGRFAQTLAEGAKGFQQGREERLTIQRQAAEDKLGIARAEAMSSPDAVQESVDAARVENQQIISTQAKTASYDSFRAYNADSNVKHLKRAIIDNPALKPVYGDTANIEKLDPAQDTNLLLQNGMDPTMFTDENIDNDAVLHRFLKVTMADGSIRLADIQKLQIASGYANYADQEALDQMLQRSTIEKNLRGQQGVPAAIEKKAKFISETTGESLESVTSRLMESEVSGVTPGKMEIANKAEESLETTFESGFFNTDFSQRENRVKASRAIREIEQAGGETLSASDRTDLKDMSMLIVSGVSVAEELTPEATGILDNFTSDVQKYLSDSNIDEIEGRAAYNAYRNALLRSFGGTAMSPSEVQNFNKAFGTLAQKYPAVIAQFKQAIEQTKAKLETISRLNNPYLSHYYLGTSQDDLDAITTRLETNLNMLKDFDRPAAPNATGEEQKDWRTLWKDKK